MAGSSKGWNRGVGTVPMEVTRMSGGEWGKGKLKRNCNDGGRTGEISFMEYYGYWI